MNVYESPYEGGLINSWRGIIEMSYRANNQSFYVLWSVKPNAAKYPFNRVRVHVGREYAKPTSFHSFVAENNYHFGRK